MKRARRQSDGIFKNGQEKNKFYNNMFFTMETANPPLRRRMSTAFAKLRAANREWDKLLHELSLQQTASAPAR